MINSVVFHIFSSHFKIIFESTWHHGCTSWRMAQTKCTGTGVTDCRAALINKWLALPGTKQLGIDPMKKLSFCMNNIVLNKAVYTCFDKVPSGGLYGKEKVVEVLFLCLLLLPFLLCCALFSLKLEGWPTRNYFSASAKGSTTALILLVPSLSSETSTEHRQSKKFLQQVTVISYSHSVIYVLRSMVCHYIYLFLMTLCRSLLKWTVNCQHIFYSIMCVFITFYTCGNLQAVIV